MKLIVWGGSLLVATPIVMVALTFGYVLWTESDFQNAPPSSDHDAYQQFIAQSAANELTFIYPVVALCLAMGITGFVLLVVGLVRYFSTRKAAALNKH